jgi:hypothetical protein
MRCWWFGRAHDARLGLRSERRSLLHVFVESGELHLVGCPYFVAYGFYDEVELRLIHVGGGVRTVDEKWCAQKDYCLRCIVKAGHLCAKDK